MWVSLFAIFVGCAVGSALGALILESCGEKALRKPRV
jgi:hypothetical protein